MTARPPRRRRCGWAPAASALARTQSQAVADAITAATGAPVELVQITTEGDRSAAAIAQLGGTGVFVDGAARGAARAASVDLAVHSYKDLPTAPAAGPDPRRRARRARTRATRWSPATGSPSASCRPGSTVGTGAPRRVAQLRALGLGLEVVPIRGNVDTRWAGSRARRPRRRRARPRRAGPARPAGRDHRDPRPAAGAARARAGRARRRVPHQRRPHPRAARPARGRRHPRLRRRRARARWPRSRPAAAPRWPPTPRSPRATTAPSCSSAPR